jgi:MFS family permease
VSWQNASQQLAVVIAGLIGVILSSLLTRAQVESWGWRVPLLFGCAIIPFLFLMRRSLAETGEFLSRKRPASTREVFRSLFVNWRILGIATMLIALSTSCFYLITAYTPAFGRTVLHLADVDNLLVTVCTGISNFLWLPVMGALSDRVGRRPILFCCTIMFLATAYPALLWLTTAPSFSRLLLVELWLSCLYGSYNAANVVFLTEVLPAGVKASGFSLAQSIAAAVFGGFTPAICTYLIDRTGNPAAPGLWLSFTATMALAATLMSRGLTSASLRTE